MSLNIKNDEVVSLVRRLARERGTDLTEAVRLAVTHELESAAHPPATKSRRLRAIARRVASYPARDLRSADELLDYDEFGLPR